ncbi:MAG TPA: Gfo/Idh/MocA family oxidoreductase [Opitutales bacterium]|nr:Gfo/Idh/MocA family oxidoreductase [Opitutales bacterium]
MSGFERNRRDFLKSAVWATLGAATAGCQGVRLGFGEGGSMAGFRTAPMEKIRVGIVGCGGRGSGGAKRFRQFGCVEVTALCDLKQGQIDSCQKILVEKGRAKAKEFLGPEAYRALCESGLCDVVYNTTPIDVHLPVARQAMLSGLHVLTEVEMTPSLAGNLELVELAEKTRRHCMMLENCCYGEDELLMFNLERYGLLGDVMHGEAGYIHDCRSLRYPAAGEADDPWRRAEILDRKRMPGNAYPTHGLGPLAQAMNINRGDRFDHLVSMSARGVALRAYAEERFGKDSKYAREKFFSTDMNTTLIRTVKGNTIMLQNDEDTPRVYTRMNLLQGTKGIVRTYPLRIAYGSRVQDHFSEFFKADKIEEVKAKYGSQIWKKLGDYAKTQGHGGMDFMMDARWIYCLHMGLPLDIDVYDSATWSVLAGLTEESVNNRSAPVEIPDFTHGSWKTAKPLGVLDIDVDTLDLLPGNRV